MIDMCALYALELKYLKHNKAIVTHPKRRPGQNSSKQDSSKKWLPRENVDPACIASHREFDFRLRQSIWLQFDFRLRN